MREPLRYCAVNPIYASDPTERTEPYLEVEGCIPQGLRGTFLFNLPTSAPGRVEGEAARPYFDRHTKVCAVDLRDDGCGFRSRYLRTAAFLQESRTGRPVPGASEMLRKGLPGLHVRELARGPGDWLRARRERGVFPSVTAYHGAHIPVGSRLFVSTDMHAAVEVGPDLTTLAGDLPGLGNATLASPHGAVDGGSETTLLVDDWHSFRLHQLRHDGFSRWVSSPKRAAPGTAEVAGHDLCVTGDLLVFNTFAIGQSLISAPRIHDDWSLRLLSADGREDHCIRLPAGTPVPVHYARARRVDERRVEIHAACLATPNELFATTWEVGFKEFLFGNLHRIDVDLVAGTATVSEPLLRSTETPERNWAHADHSIAYLLTYDGNRSGLLKRNLDTGESSTWSGKQLCSGVTFVPDPARQAQEDGGWLLGFEYAPGDTRSDCVVFDAQDLSAGPVARIRMPLVIAAGAHGAFMPAALGWGITEPAQVRRRRAPRAGGRPQPGLEAPSSSRRVG